MTDFIQEYQKVLEFICRLEDVDDIAHLFEYLDNFWQTRFETSPCIIYSSAKGKRNSFRDFWNKSKQDIYFSEEEVKIFKSHACKLSDGDNFSFEKFEEHYLYTINCGVFKTQNFFLCFKSQKIITDHIIDYLIQFVSTTLTKISRYKDADSLKSLIHIDDVTGLFNQRKFVIDIDNAILEYDKNKKPFSVIFIDIDHFKQVNDGHGHLVGTQLLKDVAGIIKATVRKEDLCYRYGGDEFVLIVPLSNYIEARDLGNRILDNIKKETFIVEDGINGKSEFKLTVSVGIASFPKDADSKVDIINMADKMMYKAKQSGRGKVCHAGELFTEEELKK